MFAQEVVMEESAPRYLYKVVSVEDWKRSVAGNQVALSPIDEEFVHLATREQLSHVEKKFWAGREYLILKIETEKMGGRLIHETNPGGVTKYYHLYDGVIPLEAVVEVLPSQ